MIWFCLFEAVAGLVAGWWAVSWWTSPAQKEARTARKEQVVVEGGVISTDRRLTPRQRHRMVQAFRQRQSLAERIRTQDRPAMRRLAQAHVGRMSPDADPGPEPFMRAMGQVESVNDLPRGLGHAHSGCYWTVRNWGAYEMWMWTGATYAQVAAGSRTDSPVEYLHDGNGFAVEARWKTGVKVVTGPLSSPPPMTNRAPQVDALKLASGDLGGLCDEHGGLLPPAVVHDAIGWPS